MSWALIKDRVGLVLAGLIGAMASWAFSNAVGSERAIYTAITVVFIYVNWENVQLRKEIRRLREGGVSGG
jgi:hypothetical protein